MRYFVDTIILVSNYDTINMDRKMSMWLGSNIGNEDTDWKWRTSHRFDYPDRFYFKNMEDKVKFILRWL